MNLLIDEVNTLALVGLPISQLPPVGGLREKARRSNPVAQVPLT